MITSVQEEREMAEEIGNSHTGTSLETPLHQDAFLLSDEQKIEEIQEYMKKIMCKKLNKECEALDYLPYPGELGKRIQENISKEGWEQWVGHQTMLINEMRLTPVDPKARKFLEEEMEKFFFGDGSQTPQGFVPEK